MEVLPDGTQVRLGVWITNTRTRRAKLTTDKLTVLADLGLEWAM
ncbi:helicase [Streptomyces sp. NBC_01483]|nr:helicase [Streptomyces sp. NBC_01483]